MTVDNLRVWCSPRIPDGDHPGNRDVRRSLWPVPSGGAGPRSADLSRVLAVMWHTLYTIHTSCQQCPVQSHNCPYKDRAYLPPGAVEGVVLSAPVVHSVEVTSPPCLGL